MPFRSRLSVTIVLIIAFGQNLNASPNSDITMMRTAIFGSLLTKIFVYLQDDYDMKSEFMLDFDNLSLSYLQGKEFSDGRYLKDNQISLNIGLQNVLFENSYLSISQHHEFLINRWYSTNSSSQNRDGYIYGYSPIFTYKFKGIKINDFKLYAEMGAGLAYMDKSLVEDRQKTTQFQFIDSIGLGFASDDYKIGYRFTHLSNLNIGTPNPSIDFHQILISYSF